MNAADLLNRMHEECLIILLQLLPRAKTENDKAAITAEIEALQEKIKTVQESLSRFTLIE